MALTMEIQQELRPCMVNDKKALFHMWEQCSEILAPSIMVGGHNGGVLNYVMGIIETETGEIKSVHPHSIRFVDNKIQDYYFEDDNRQQ